MYYVDGTPHSERSPKNQKILDLFVQKEVLKDISEIVNYVLDTSRTDNAPPFTWEDIQCETTVLCPHCDEEALEEVVVSADMVTPDYYPEVDLGEQYVCPLCGTPYGTQEEARQCCVGQIAYLCTNCQTLISQEDMEDLESESATANETWYLVSDWLCSKMKEAGEIVIQTPEYSIWGCTSAGKLAEEPIIQQICAGLGILEGQPHEWPVQ